MLTALIVVAALGQPPRWTCTLSGAGQTTICRLIERNSK